VPRGFLDKLSGKARAKRKALAEMVDYTREGYCPDYFEGSPPLAVMQIT